MTKLVNLMPLLIDIDEAATLDDCLDRLCPRAITEKGIRVRPEKDTEKSYLEGVDLDGEDRKKYHALFDRFTADNPAVDQLAKEAHDHWTELDGVPHIAGHKGVLSEVVYYLVGLTYGSYLRKKYGEDCKMFVGDLRSYELDPVSSLVCLLFGLAQAGHGYSNVLAYQHITTHHYYKTRAGGRRTTDGWAIASIVFASAGWERSVFGSLHTTPSKLQALEKTIGTETPTASSASS